MEERSMNPSAKINKTDSSAEWMPAIVSIDMQIFGNPSNSETGFRQGTIFPALYKPFTAGGTANG